MAIINSLHKIQFITVIISIIIDSLGYIIIISPLIPAELP